MQWSNLENAGFTTGQPWIDIPENYHSINVEAAINDENSVLHTYRILYVCNTEFSSFMAASTLML